MKDFKNKSIFYQLADGLLHPDNVKFGISYITNDLIINRACSYQCISRNYLIFGAGIVCSEKFYKKIEYLFKKFIKNNKKYGYRHEERRLSELYYINENLKTSIMEEFYNYIKTKYPSEYFHLLSKEEIEELNKNFEELQKNDNSYIIETYISEGEEDNEEEYKDVLDTDFKLRDYQQKTYDEWNGRSGILCYHPGLGKTITCMALIHKYFNILNPDKTKIVLWSTYQISILISQKDDFDKMKKIYNFNIIDAISDNSKKQKYIKSQIDYKKINIIITNNDSLETFMNIDYDITLFVSDECKRITAEKPYQFMKYCKNENINILGLDGTPIKINDIKSYSRIKEIFGEDYLIDHITYIEAIERDLCVPITFKMFMGNNKKTSKKYFKKLIKKHKEELFDGSKIITWSKDTNTNQQFYDALIEENIPNYQTYITDSKIDPKNKNIKGFLEGKRNKIISCVERMREGANDKYARIGIMTSNIQNQEAHVMIQMTARVTRIVNEPDFKKDNAEFWFFLTNDLEDDKKSYFMKKILSYHEMISDEEMKKLTYQRENRKIKIIGKETGKTIMEFDIEEDANYIKRYDFNIIDLYHELKYPNENMTIEKFIELLREYDIDSSSNYFRFVQNNPSLNLPKFYSKLYPNFNWNMV